ncbi:MAG: NifB/NifX family molybdenum-iron cluster-binding protein [Erysipelotrichaceae bacterium]
MRIAISIESNTPSGVISASFSRAPYFMIYDTETKVTDFIDNTKNMTEQGAGPRVIAMLKEAKIDTAIAESCGENVVMTLNNEGVVFFHALKISAMEALALFLNNRLHLLSDIHQGHHTAGTYKV